MRNDKLEILAGFGAVGIAIIVVALILGVYIGATALVTAVVNLWAVEQGGLWFVWGANIALSVVWAIVTFVLKVIGGLATA